MLYRTIRLLRPRTGRRCGAVAAVGLYLLLSIGLIEPLACIVHCQFQAHRHTPTPLAHAHVMPDGSVMADPGRDVAARVVSGGAFARYLAVTTHLMADGRLMLNEEMARQVPALGAENIVPMPAWNAAPAAPAPPIPLPYHEMMLAAVAVAVALLVRRGRALDRAHPAPLITHAPPWRPPILALG